MKTLIYKNGAVYLYKVTEGRAHYFRVEVGSYCMAPFNWRDALTHYNNHRKVQA